MESDSQATTSGRRGDFGESHSWLSALQPAAAFASNLNWFVFTCQRHLRQLVSNSSADCFDDEHHGHEAVAKEKALPFTNDLAPLALGQQLANSYCSQRQKDNQVANCELCQYRTVSSICSVNRASAVQVDYCPTCGDQRLKSIDMDIDLHKAIERFQRYCSVYSDSPLSSCSSKQKHKYASSSDEENAQHSDNEGTDTLQSSSSTTGIGRGRLSSSTLDGVNDVGDKNRKLVDDKPVARLGRSGTTTNYRLESSSLHNQRRYHPADPAALLKNARTADSRRAQSTRRDSDHSQRSTTSSPASNSKASPKSNMTVIRHRVTVSTGSYEQHPQQQQQQQQQEQQLHSPSHRIVQYNTNESALRPQAQYKQALVNRRRLEQRQYPVSVSAEDIARLLQPTFYARPGEEVGRVECDHELSVGTGGQAYGESSCTGSPALTMASPSSEASSACVKSSTYRSTPSTLAEECRRRKSEEEREQVKSFRRQRYKAKLDKAKRDFLQNHRGSVAELSKSREEFAKKFKVSTEDMDKRVRDLEPARGPYLAYLSRSGNLHINAHDVAPEYKPPRSRYDRVHREMCDRAERMWANYQKRKADSRLNLYARTRGFSTGFLEAAAGDEDEITSEIQSPEHYFTTEETDLDVAQQCVTVDRVPATQTRRRRPPAGAHDHVPAKEQHRARSADFLLSRANREQAEPPENQLRRVMGDHHQQQQQQQHDYEDDEEELHKLELNLSEHELRFQKSLEKLHLPDWYLQSKYAREKAQLSPVDQRQSAYGQRAWGTVKPGTMGRPDEQSTYAPTPRSRTYSSMRERSTRTSTPFDIPGNFFDKYKDEIEELRKSRSELNHLKGGDNQYRRLPPPPLKSISVRPPAAAIPVPVAASKPTKVEYTETYTLQKKVVTVSSETSAFSAVSKEKPSAPTRVSLRKKPEPSRQVGPGYSLSSPPTCWNVPKQRDSVVVDVLESAVTPRKDRSKNGPGFSNLTLEEALDALLSLADAPRHLAKLDEALSAKDAPVIRPLTPTSFYRPAVYVENDQLMERCAREPNRCRALLNTETVWVRCACCGRTEEMTSAKGKYVSCRHCYTYYCSYGCRSEDWLEHKYSCTYARVNTVCKEVIIRVKSDLVAQKYMSLIAQRGYATRGRGCVNMRFLQLEVANRYIAQGWPAIAQDPQCLSYLTITDLVEMGKSGDLVVTCRQYNPSEKFILSVSILVEIDRVPRTPLFGGPAPLRCGEPQTTASNNQYYDRAATNGYEAFNRSLPPNRRYQQAPPVLERQASASHLLKNVLRSLENIAPEAPEMQWTPSTDRQFDRANRVRHTVDSGRRASERNKPVQQDCEAIFAKYVDETEV